MLAEWRKDSNVDHHDAESKSMISRRSQVRIEKEQQRRSPRRRKQTQLMIFCRHQVRIEKEQQRRSPRR